MKKLVLKAGVPADIGLTGRFFRIFSAQALVNIDFYSSYDNGEWSLSTPLLAGIGLNFSSRPAPYTKFTIVSDVDQTIEYFAGLDIADDDRLSGASTVTVNSTGSSSQTLPIQTLNDTVNGSQVLSFSENRKTALIQLSGDCYVSSVDDGILVTGAMEWENRGALTLIPVNAGTEVRILEEFS
ncbi:hypothetical protein [Thalassotalea hakodatensis]|uniref:hypothetical protein n=1 Tax=Thalassotalea hakodatensis TaxID=3030492 RepID=UPI002573D3FC|nr:hypothetical protein [Thalassotalea hakodatensis]